MKKEMSCHVFFTDSKQHKTHKVNMIFFRNHALWVIHDMITCNLGYYYTLNSLSLFWLAKSVQWIFEISCRLHNQGNSRSLVIISYMTVVHVDFARFCLSCLRLMTLTKTLIILGISQKSHRINVYNLQLDNVTGAYFKSSLFAFSQSEKR